MWRVYLWFMNGVSYPQYMTDQGFDVRTLFGYVDWFKLLCSKGGIQNALGSFGIL